MTFSNGIILNLFIFFFAYSLLGWILESSYRSLVAKKFINSGFLFGPILPIFGFSALVAVSFWYLFDFNIHLAVLFGVLFINSFEYLTAVFSEKFFGLKLWDYSSFRFNYKGRVSIESSLVWAFLLYLFLTFIHPLVLAQVLFIPVIYKIVLLVFCISLLLADFIISLLEALGLRRFLKMDFQKIKNYIDKNQNRYFRHLQVFPDLYAGLMNLLKNKKNIK